MTWTPPDTAPCVQLRHTVGPNAAARIFTPERRDLITGAPLDDYDAGREALATCARCLHWEACVTASVARNERFSIAGGAGGQRRRALRRAYGTDRWDDALAAHGRRLHGDPAQPGDDALLAAHGDEAECGRRGKFAKGHRCDACSLAAGLEGALGGSLAAAAAAWAEGLAA